MNTGRLLLGVLAGAAAGAIIGVLYAPDKGVNTRRNISKKGEEYMNDMKDKFGEFVDGITEKFSNSTDAMNDLGDKVKGKARESRVN